MYDAWQRMFLWQTARAKAAKLPKVWASLDSPQAVCAFQDKVRAQLWQNLGGLPDEKCDLQATITGTIAAPDYRIGKLHFQSLPGFFVTANLYVPADLKDKAPAVLVPCGHHATAKAWHEYQTLCANLARRGFVVLIFDPLGQAERGPVYSYYYGDAHGNAHDVQGYQCQLTGRPLSFYFVWDCIRALDCLCSRAEVDVERIACTGNSGGGMQTTHLAALDERIKSAASVCNTGSHFDVFTSWVLHPEGNFPDVFATHSANNENLAICVAPRRQLLIAASEDHLSATGMTQLFETVRQIYAVLGADENVEMITPVNHHSYSRAMRQMVYHRMVETLNPLHSGSMEEYEVPIFSAEELNATRTGHVEELGSKSVHQLNLELALEQVQRHREYCVKPIQADSARQLVQDMQTIYLPDPDFEISGELIPLNCCDAVGTPVSVEIGTEEHSTLRQYRLATGADQLGLQSVNVYQPASGSDRAMLFLRDSGYVQCGDLIRYALRDGVHVISGELPACDQQRMLLAGVTPAGYGWLIWRDILNQLKQSLGLSTIHIVAQGRLANLVAFPLAAENMQRLRGIVLINGYLSLLDFISGPRQNHPDIQNTPGLLKHFDIPQLLAALAERQIILANPYNNLDELHTINSIEPALQPLRRTLKRAQRESNLRTVIEPEEQLYSVLGGLLVPGTKPQDSSQG